MNTQIIAIANQKGGVGKTTTCANLGIGLAQAGKKVLLIDGDPQGSLTISLGNPQPDKLPFTLSDAMGRILMDEPLRPGEGILHHPEGVDLMPADIQLSGMEVSLVNAMSRETILRQYLDTLKGQYSHILIDCQQTFDLVQKIRSNVRRYPNGWGEAAPLTGLLYCADCGGKMYVHRTNNGKRISQYTCSNYTKVPCGTLCPTQHRINESAVLTLVSDTLRAIAEYSRNDRKEFIHTVQETQVAQQSADIAKKRRRLAAAQKRAGELEKLICKIYEDNALGKLPDARYRALDAQYAKEQDVLEIEIAELEKAVTGYEQSQKSAEKFIALIDKYENFDTLTNTMLNEFVEKILVHERARKGSQDTTQEIEIYFNFLGRYIPPSLQPVPLTPEEQEELRKKEERKDRLHQNYLKRKASGAQKRYEDKIKAKKKAEMDAKKALIRAEDMKKGVFSTVGQLPKEEPRKGSIAASAAV